MLRKTILKPPFFLGLFILNAWALLIFLLSLFIHSGVTSILIGSVGGWILGMVLAWKYQQVFLWAFLFSIPLCIAYSCAGKPLYQNTLGLKTISLKSPIEVPQHPHARSFKIKDIQPRFDKIAWTVESHPTRIQWHNYSAAIPLVSSTWNENEPVSLWAVCDYYTRLGTQEDWANYLHENCISKWKEPLYLVVKVLSENSSWYTKAISQIENIYQLRSAPKAAIVLWNPPLKEEIQKNQKILWITVVSVNLAWIIGYPLFLARHSQKQKKQIV